MTRTDCAHIEALLSARLDGAATPTEVAEIARHLDDCADCQTTATAFTHVDRRVRTYLRATPVPEIAAPWHTAPQTRRFAIGRPAMLALTTLLVLVVGAVLSFGPLNRDVRPSQQVSAPQSAYTASGDAAASADPTAAPPPAGAAERNAAPALAPAAGGAAGNANARATTAGNAGSAAPLNPVQQLRLSTATNLTLCQPTCEPVPQATGTLAQVVAALDTPLAVIPPPPAATTAPVALLRFTLPQRQQLDLRYYPTLERLQLPTGEFVSAPATLAEALGGLVTQP